MLWKAKNDAETSVSQAVSRSAHAEKASILEVAVHCSLTEYGVHNSAGELVRSWAAVAAHSLVVHNCETRSLAGPVAHYIVAVELGHSCPAEEGTAVEEGTAAGRNHPGRRTILGAACHSSGLLVVSR